ncbi:protein with conserved beta tubulin folding factor domain [Cryptosporidium ryanae]|uniref:protein with conserved beta tubulin folding factor domain n=1 Tax=Cryptosporidium ryanae TaxID=515981 RepID=UPI00351A781D|nr:protein with conserved beta tubulin folding factor domain [Cryptosporidium ryanae]
MTSVLIPKVEFILQLYIGFEFKEATSWGEDVIYLYLSLLKEFSGSSIFLGFETWKNFVIGQEIMLGKSFDNDVSESSEFSLSSAFWSLKKRLLGTREVERLYLFSSKNLSLYWVNLVGNLVLENSTRTKYSELISFEKSVRKCSYRWKRDSGVKKEKLNSLVLSCNFNNKLNENLNNKIRERLYYNSCGEKIEVLIEIFAMFILIQFIFIGNNYCFNKFDLTSGMYSKESYIAIIKYFQRNLSILLRINSLFVGRGEFIESNDNLELFNLFFSYIPTKTKGENEKIYAESSKVELKSLSVDYFNYHLLPESSNEMVICILLNENSKMINFQFLESFYIIKGSSGTKSEKVTYYLSERVVNSSSRYKLLENNSENNDGNVSCSYIKNFNSFFDEHIDTGKEDIIYSDDIYNVMTANSCYLNLFITKPIDMLYLVNCTGCNVYCLDLIGYIKIEDCVEINIHVDCMSMSLNKCKDCNIFVHSQFSPSIINSNNIYLGPFNIHCINRKTSYLRSSESGLLTENWCFPISFNSSFNILEPKKLYVLELMTVNDSDTKNPHKIQNFPLPKMYQQNFAERKSNLKIFRNMDALSREEIIGSFIDWVRSKHVF